MISKYFSDFLKSENQLRDFYYPSNKMKNKLK